MTDPQPMSTSSAGLLALAERCEAATGRQQRALLIASAEAALIADGQDADTEDAMGWLDRFEAFVEAGAFLDAAMTLVPEDRGPLRFFSLEHDAHDGARWIARFDSAGDECGHGQTIYCEGNTPALALCAAALRARASQEQQQ
jgi:hypothetical protein